MIHIYQHYLSLDYSLQFKSLPMNKKDIFTVLNLLGHSNVYQSKAKKILLKSEKQRYVLCSPKVSSKRYVCL